MTEVYYLDGLGGNRHYLVPLTEALAKKGYNLHYLPLPGHPEALDVKVNSRADLLAWFEEKVLESDIILMGYSLGADMASFLAYQTGKVRQLLLLDGGIWTFDDYPWEQELADSRAYLDNQVYEDLAIKIAQEQEEYPHWADQLAQAVQTAYIKKDGNYQLNLNADSVFDLLKLRREILFTLSKTDYQVPTLLLLADSPAPLLELKMAQVNKIPHQQVQVDIVENTSHQLYLEKPESLAVLICQFIKV